MKSSLIIVRHAHRDKDLGHAHDNGLSEKGQRQVQALIQYCLQFKGRDLQFYSSPKQRCVETLGPVAKSLEHDLEIDINLIEGEDSDRRAQALIRDFKNDPFEGITFWCSHGDVIPELLWTAMDQSRSLKKCGLIWLEYDPQSKEFSEVECVQDWI